MITGSQVRAARAFVRLTVAELATVAQVSPNTVVRVEREDGVNTSTLAAIQRALEAAGIEFLPAGADHGPGVRLKA